MDNKCVQKHIVYVVLHYQNQSITEKCIDQLLGISKESQIVVVDNFSPNGSGKKIAEKYSHLKKVHVLQTKKNTGFARGNNVGYRYAKEKLKADIIVVMNSDIMIEQKEFETILKKFCRDKKYYVIGPDIINADERHQNPLRKTRVSSYKALRSFVFYSIGVFCIKTGFLRKTYYKLYKSRITHGTQVVKNELSNTNFGEKSCVLHGSCIIFLKDYLRQHDQAFWPFTFLYVEEDILNEIVMSDKKEEIYIPDLKVRHLESQSTIGMFDDNNEKTVFHLKHQAWSYFQLLLYRCLKFQL